MNGLVSAIRPGTRLIIVGDLGSAAVGRGWKCTAGYHRQRIYLLYEADGNLQAGQGKQ